MANYRNSKIGKKIQAFGYDTNIENVWIEWIDLWKESSRQILIDYIKLDEISFLEKYDTEITKILKVMNKK